MFAIRPTVITSAAAASIALLAAPLSASAGIRPVYGHTPSGNITCKAQNYGGPGWSLVCSARNPGRTMRISTQGRSYEASYRRVARRGVRLSYGKMFDLGPFSCYSDTDGLSCYGENRQGTDEGFFLSKESARLY